MNALTLDGAEAGLGRPLVRLAAVAVAAGIAAVGAGLLSGRTALVLGALDASFLFFAGLATGSVALSAAIRISHGAWGRPILPIAEAGARFFPAAALLLVVLAAAAGAFVHRLSGHGIAPWAMLSLRLVVAGAVVFALGRRFVARAQQGEAEDRVRSAAVAYVAAYAVALSVWAYDLVLGLVEAAPYTVVPAFYFVGAFLSGFAWVALVAAARDVSGPDLRHDVGKLLFGFIIVWSYLLWSLFLATWYANVPEESAPLLLRWSDGWRPLAKLVLVSVFAWPFWLLFSEKMKRRRITLAVGAGAVLLGLWAERFLLVLPSLALPGGAVSLLVGGGVSLGVAGLYLLSVGPGLGGVRTGPG